MAKNKFTVFFSWQMDSPKEENYLYLNSVLNNAAKSISERLNLQVEISTDSRDEDGTDTIDVTVIKKISACDLFVADISAIKGIEIRDDNGEVVKKKLIPNPNVMYELGYAVSTLGWNRVILVWNDKSGNKDFAPFDIRNHISLSYYRDKDDSSKKRSLTIEELLEDKITHYDELVIQGMQSEDRKHDVRMFYETESIVGERALLDTIDRAVGSRAHYYYEYSYWDNLVYRYKNNPQSRYIDDEIDEAYSLFIGKLEELQKNTTKYFYEVHFNPPRENNDRLFKQRDSFMAFHTPEEALADQAMLDGLFNSLYADLIKTYSDYRRLIQKKLKV